MIYYISQKLSGPPLHYSNEEKISLAIVFSTQKLHNYILFNHTRVVDDSNPMRYLLRYCLLQGCTAEWVVILQEFDLEFVAPKGTKALALAPLMIDLPPLSASPPITVNLPDEFLFVISMKYPWYGDILLYLHTQKFRANLSHKYRRRI